MNLANGQLYRRGRDLAGKSGSVEKAEGAESLAARVAPARMRCKLCWAFLCCLASCQ